METKSNNETDIRTVFVWVKKGRDNFLLKIDSFIKFIVRNVLWLIGLVVAGMLLGWLLDSLTPQKYESSVLIHANQNSAEYVYNFVEGFNKKLGDTSYLEANGFRKHEIEKVEIDPIVNFNNLLEKYKNKNVALLETLLENASAKDILESEFFRSDYMFHKIQLDLGQTADSATIPKFIHLIDENPYFRELNVVARAHTNRTLASYNELLKQIDTTVANFNSKLEENSQSNRILISSDESNLVNDLLVNKKITLLEMEKFKIDSISLQQPIMLINEPILVKRHSLLSNLKVLLPILFVIFFFIISYFRYSVRKIRRERAAF